MCRDKVSQTHHGNVMVIGGDGMPCMPHAGHDAGAVVAPKHVPDVASKGAYPGNPGESAMMAKVGEKRIYIATTRRGTFT